MRMTGDERLKRAGQMNYFQELLKIDTGGLIMYSEKFYDQEFTFERGNFGSGLYFFQIADDKGQVFSGKVVISEQ